MKTQPASRLVRLGAARKLTRAASVGRYDELNPIQKYTIPPGE
jgi:hypothetical protein|nr:hypothetical protein [uncultured Brevundimonas sp.]|tara:strand:- start:295 stop:423 length:129 start_codon:yes stop_codon:yes gene_type:complete